MAAFTVQQICPQCRGTGVVDSTVSTPEEGDPETQVEQVTCPLCSGDEKVDWGYIVVPNAYFRRIVDAIVAALS